MLKCKIHCKSTPGNAQGSLNTESYLSNQKPGVILRSAAKSLWSCLTLFHRFKEMAGGLILYLVHLFASMSLFFAFRVFLPNQYMAIDQIYSHIYIYIHIELIYLHLHSHIPEALVFFFIKKGSKNWKGAI